MTDSQFRDYTFQGYRKQKQPPTLNFQGPPSVGTTNYTDRAKFNRYAGPSMGAQPQQQPQMSGAQQPQAAGGYAGPKPAASGGQLGVYYQPGATDYKGNPVIDYTKTNAAAKEAVTQGDFRDSPDHLKSLWAYAKQKLPDAEYESLLSSGINPAEMDPRQWNEKIDQMAVPAMLLKQERKEDAVRFKRMETGMQDNAKRKFLMDQLTPDQKTELWSRFKEYYPDAGSPDVIPASQLETLLGRLYGVSMNPQQPQMQEGGYAGPSALNYQIPQSGGAGREDKPMSAVRAVGASRWNSMINQRNQDWVNNEKASALGSLQRRVQANAKGVGGGQPLAWGTGLMDPNR
jgi:hypothetical protein